jgi:hypothetical protein
MSGGTLSYNQNRTLNVLNNLTVDADSEIAGYSNNHILSVSGNLIVNTGVSLLLGAVQVAVSGTTDLNGDLTVSGFGQTRTFSDFTINSGGSATFTGGDTYIMTGDMTNNGTFTASSFGQTFNFTSSSGSISGSGLLSFFAATFNSPAAYANTGNVQIRDNMSGTGSFTNGAGAQLELQNGGPFTVTTFDASPVGNTITYTGFGNPTAFSGDYYNLVLNKSSGSLSFGSSLSVLNDITIQSGILSVNAVTLNIGNDLLIQGGEFTPDNASALVNISGDLNMTAGEYDHNNGEVNVTGAFDASGGAFFIDGASSVLNAGSGDFSIAMTMNDGIFSMSGDLDLNTGAALNGSGTDTKVGGTFWLNDGTAQFTSGIFTPTNLTIATGEELVITNATLTSTGTATINGTITFSGSSGTKTVGDILVAVGGTWNMTQPNSVTVGGDIENNGTFTGDPGYGSSIYTLTSSSGSISGSSALAIRDILINSPASYTNTTDLTVAGTLNGTGSFTNGVGATLTYRGNNSGGSNFTIASFTASATGNTVVYAATTYSQRWRATTSATNDYYNVTVNTQTGDYQRLNLVADVRVNGTLTITEGDVVLNGFDLEMAAGANITGSDIDDYIRVNGAGVVRQYYSATGGTVFIPVGDNSGNYSPITAFTLNAGTLGATPFVDFSLTDANHPNRNTNNLGLGGNDDGTPATDYISRYWTVSGNDITNPDFDVSYVYVDSDITGTESNMIGALYRTPPGFGFNDWDNTGIVTPATNTVTLSNADNFGDLYAMDDDQSRLPVVLLSFGAEADQQKVHLKWATASEESNDFYTIERSSDGLHFEEVLTVAGAGNSNEVLTYMATDAKPLPGRTFYRLKQTDFNGTFEYSEVVSVYIDPTRFQDKGRIYPNPVKRGARLNIAIEGSGSGYMLVEMFNPAGMTVLSEELSIDFYRDNSFEIPENLKAGVYILRITSAEGQFQKRVLVQ